MSLYFENADADMLTQSLASVTYGKGLILAGIPVSRLAVLGMEQKNYKIVTGKCV
jgi:hypothetical protein